MRRVAGFTVNVCDCFILRGNFIYLQTVVYQSAPCHNIQTQNSAGVL